MNACVEVRRRQVVVWWVWCTDVNDVVSASMHNKMQPATTNAASHMEHIRQIMSVRMIFATIFATQNTREWHMWVVTWVMWPYIFLRLSKFTRQKTTQPWWPLLRYYYYAATSNRDMSGGERHHQRPYYAMMIDDMLPSSWLAHKTTSNIVHHLMTWKYSSLTTCMVPSIKDCCGVPSYHLTDIYV